MDALPTISHVTLGVEKIELNKLYLFVIFLHTVETVMQGSRQKR